MTKRAEAFNTGLREAIRPKLREESFVFDNSRTFRRFNDKKTYAQIINFQLGQRSLEGKFTVNLSVYWEGDIKGKRVEKALEYHCPLNRRGRLSSLMPDRLKMFAGKPFLRRWIPATCDTWWLFNENEKFTRKQQEKVLTKIIELGLPWLDSHIP